MWDSMEIEGAEYLFLCFYRKYTTKKTPTKPKPNQPTKKPKNQSTANEQDKLSKTLEWLISLLALGEFLWYAMRQIKHICAQIYIKKKKVMNNAMCWVLLQYANLHGACKDESQAESLYTFAPAPVPRAVV